MQNKEGKEITKIRNGFYWYKEGEDSLYLIKIIKNTAFFHGTDDATPFLLSECDGDIIEHIEKPKI